MFGFLLLVSLLGAGAAVGEAEPTDSEAVAYSLDAVEIAVIEDLTPHSDIELSAEMVNSYMRSLRLSRGDRVALTRVLVDELWQDGIFKPMVSKASDSL